MLTQFIRDPYMKVKPKELPFYRLPSKNSKIYNEWVIKGRLNNTSKNSRMCSTHFINGKRDCPDTVPTIFPWSKLWKTPAERPFVLAVRELARGMTMKEIRPQLLQPSIHFPQTNNHNRE